jgi:hypothetical protein
LHNVDAIYFETANNPFRTHTYDLAEAVIYLEERGFVCFRFLPSGERVAIDASYTTKVTHENILALRKEK